MITWILMSRVFVCLQSGAGPGGSGGSIQHAPGQRVRRHRLRKRRSSPVVRNETLSKRIDG